MSLSPAEDEIVDHLQEIARLRRVLVVVKYLAESKHKDALEIILDLVNEVLGVDK